MNEIYLLTKTDKDVEVQKLVASSQRMPLESLNHTPQVKVGDFTTKFNGLTYNASVLAKQGVMITSVEGLIPWRVMLADSYSFTGDEIKFRIVSSGSTHNNIRRVNGVIDDIEDIDLLSPVVYLRNTRMEIHDYIKTGGSEVYLYHKTLDKRVNMPNIYDDGRVCSGNVDTVVGRVKTVQMAMRELISNPPNLDLAPDAQFKAKVEDGKIIVDPPFRKITG